jgi:zinc protease
VSVSAGNIPFQRVGIFLMNATVKPGVDPALVERRLDEVMQELIARGPTADEVRRAARDNVAETIRGLEQVGGFSGKAVALAEGQVYAADPDFYAKRLRTYASITPAEVQRAMAEWLVKPAFSVRLEPGERGAYEEAGASSSGARAEPKAAPNTAAAPRGAPRQMPALAELQALDFPSVTHATLSNGVRVHHAQRTAVPVTQMALSFNAGYAADAPNARGLQNLTVALLDEGTTTRSSQAIAEAQERLGAEINTSGSADRSTVSMSALTPNLAPSLELLADIVKNPAFAPEEVERVRAQTLTAIAQQQRDPNGIAQRAIPALIYGANHPYGGTAIGEPEAVARFGQADLVRFKDQYLRPDNLDIFIVSDQPLAQLTPQLEQHFGRWQAPALPKGAKAFTTRPMAATGPKIVLIDRPGSPQSVIVGGALTPVNPRGDVTALTSANDILGGNFLSRINMDLRETRGWSYGVRGSLQLNEQAVPYLISAPVQADRTGESVAALIENYEAFLGPKGVTPEELTRTINNNIFQLPGQFETSAAVLRAMQTNALLGRPDDYHEQLAERYRGQTAASLDAAARAAIDPGRFVWVVVGEAAKVRPQLAKLGIPIEVRSADVAAPAAGGTRGQ